MRDTVEDAPAIAGETGSALGPMLFRVACSDDLGQPSGRWPLARVDEVTIGRAASLESRAGARALHLGLPDRFASARHARVDAASGAFRVSDLGSMNGTWVDGVRVAEGAAVDLRDGAIVEVGHTFFLFRAGPRGGSAAAGALDVDGGRPTLCPEWAEELDKLERVARTPHALLLAGESGAGKELVARQVHERSGRSGALVAVNCAALPEALLEDELFGHVPGAFSGAQTSRSGLLRAAHEGTLLLDEIGDMPLALQAKLLRVLEDGKVRPLGSERELEVDVRVIAATNRDLPALAAAQKFRSDLLARIGLLVVEVPPLRSRREDLGLLLRALLAAAGHPLGQRRCTVEALRLLLLYRWPFNVRELKHALLTGFDLAPELERGLRTLSPEHLPAALRGAPAAKQIAAQPAPEAAAPPQRERPLSPDEAQLRARLVESLRRHRGNAAAVARDLGKARSHIQRWVARFGLELGAFRRGDG